MIALNAGQKFLSWSHLPTGAEFPSNFCRSELYMGQEILNLNLKNNI